jgi:hypothetical protein
MCLVTAILRPHKIWRRGGHDETSPPIAFIVRFQANPMPFLNMRLQGSPSIDVCGDYVGVTRPLAEFPTVKVSKGEKWPNGRP